MARVWPQRHRKKKLSFMVYSVNMRYGLKQAGQFTLRAICLGVTYIQFYRFIVLQIERNDEVLQ